MSRDAPVAPLLFNVSPGTQSVHVVPIYACRNAKVLAAIRSKDNRPPFSMPAIASTVANLFSRNSVFVGTVFFGAFGFGIGFDKVTSAWWDSHNKGKQWKDIRPAPEA